MPAKREAPPIAPVKRLLTRRQVSELYSVSIDHLERVSTADLPRIKIGTKTVLYDVNDVEDYFRKRKLA